jgi:hypothetical protein
MVSLDATISGRFEKGVPYAHVERIDETMSRATLAASVWFMEGSERR